jgi:hypothetical protein
MTQTLTRAIRVAVGEELAKHGIDDLGLDMDLTKVVMNVIQEKQSTTPEQRRQNAIDAVHKGMLNGSPCYEYPEELSPLADQVCKLWMLKAPRKPRKTNERSEYSFWVTSLRDLLDACGEYGVELLTEMRSDYEAEMMSNGGLAPFMVTGPSSLVKSARAKAALKRQGIAGIARRDGKQQPARQTRLDV